MVAVATPCWPAPGLRDDPRLPHPLGEEPLAERVVDLVGAGVAEVLALEIDPRAAGVLREPRRRTSSGVGPAHVVGAERGQPLAGRPGRAGPPR